MYRFEKLEVWKMAVQYALAVYKLTRLFPKEELFGLTSQLKRAVISISSNIAEGSGSATIRDFCNFLDIAIKSTLETVSQLILAKELVYINEKDFNKLYEDSEILVKRIRTLKAYLKKPRAPRPNHQPFQEGYNV
ncbi:four helix bundle protein [Candidatus Daviesbacteria bacterium]|nr:four helix bundle protein [Candidatus Daviesbacteria bacterium]